MILRIRQPGGIVHDVPLGPAPAVPLRGYSRRGAAIGGSPAVGQSARERARAAQARYVDAHRDQVNARRHS
jgi:hypothetical protein